MNGSDFARQRASLSSQLTLVFDVQVGRKFGLLRPEIPNLEVPRAAPGRLKDVLEHLESHLTFNDPSNQLLLKAVCVKPSSSHSRHLQWQQQQQQQLSNGSLTYHRPATRRGHYGRGQPMWDFTGVVPLVCNQIWSSILTGYPGRRIKILVDQNVPEVKVRPPGCFSGFFKQRELKYLDVGNFLPSKGLKSAHILKLCRDIFERGVRIKPELRRGVWLHLVGVFHPCLEAREDREHYIEKLRMTYDHLKGKLMGEDVDHFGKQQLVDAVHRDAVRTDPSHPFFASHRRRQNPNESYISQHYHPQPPGLDNSTNNIDKLINIIVIYTLEHGQISYTQGMTDILSPILYIMQDEADAYICFSAMVERIKDHFNPWCTGTLYKLERLRHLCEVLDPKLFQCLTASNEEDVFVLFFGMVLIECRREFSFEDSFHMLETVWASVVCSQNYLPSSSRVSKAEWARFMTYESPEVLNQVFNESGNPYSAVPLPHTMSGSYILAGGFYSRNPSLILSQSPPVIRRQLSEADIPRNSSVLGGRVNVIPEVSDAHPSSSYHSSTNSLDGPLDNERGNSSEESNQHRPISGAGQTEAEREPELLNVRMRSQSDSKLKLHSSQSTLESTRSPTRGRGPCISPSADGEGSVVTVTNQNKLGSSSFSHSESELYDSFSNSNGTLKAAAQPFFSRNPTEMSDMSSLSSGNASANNLHGSYKSADSGRRSGGGSRRRLTPEAGGPSGSLSRKARHRLLGRQEHNSTSSDATTASSNMEGEGGRINDKDEEEEEPDDFPLPPDSLESSEFKDALDTLNPEDSTSRDPDSAAKPRNGHTFNGQDHDATGTADPSDTGTKHPNHITTLAEVHNNGLTYSMMGGSSEEIDVGLPVFNSSALLHEPEPQVVEHNGRITSITSHLQRSPLLPRNPNSEASYSSHVNSSASNSIRPHPHSDGDVLPRRRPVSSPKKIHRARTSISEHNSNCSSPVEGYSDGRETPSRVTPVAFFDAMGKIASSAPGSRIYPNPLASIRDNERRTINEANYQGRRRDEAGEGEEGREEEDEREEERSNNPQMRRQLVNDSELEVSMLMSQLVSTEAGAPRINTEDSLAVPFTDCYSLFICLAILVQNREEILQNGADFYQLSTILNAQAAGQDLDRTLIVARQLYRVYRQYQRMWFGGDDGDDSLCNEWLDAEVRGEGGVATRRTGT